MGWDLCTFSGRYISCLFERVYERDGDVPTSNTSKARNASRSASPRFPSTYKKLTLVLNTPFSAFSFVSHHVCFPATMLVLTLSISRLLSYHHTRQPQRNKSQNRNHHAKEWILCTNRGKVTRFGKSYKKNMCLEI